MVIYLDSGDLEAMRKYRHQVSGLTTNPSLLKKSGITNYLEFAGKAVEIADGLPLSLEVLADTVDEMYRQAQILGSLAPNVYVKIPVTNTQGLSTGPLISKLSGEGVRVNVTALMTLDQVKYCARYLSAQTPAILSIFAGRIADTGRDPVPFITDALRVKHDKTKILWASTRELLNIRQAQMAGCDIITVSPEILSKMHLFGKDLNQYSLETATQFHQDGQGLTI